LIDEVDAKPDAPWPYATLLPYLDANIERATGLVFVLAGSSGEKLTDFVQLLEQRPKGRDLLSRIPLENRWAIAPLNAGDRIVVVVSQILHAASLFQRSIREVEKLALYFAATSAELTKARQLRELAVRAVRRASSDGDDDRIRYGDLFERPDPEEYRFWASADLGLQGRFIFVADQRPLEDRERSPQRPTEPPPPARDGELEVDNDKDFPFLTVAENEAKQRLIEQKAIGMKLLRRVVRWGATDKFDQALRAWSIDNHALMLRIFETDHLAATQTALARGGLIAPDNYIVQTDEVEDRVAGQLQLIDQLLDGLPIFSAHTDRRARRTASSLGTSKPKWTKELQS
jgi:hypothetical protein